MRADARAMSLKARVRNRAAALGLAPHVVLQNYMFERFLVRLATSPWRERFVLKGGLLVAHLHGLAERATMDMDATVRGFALTADSAVAAVAAVCAVDAGDGIAFSVASGEPIRRNDPYGGFRVHFDAAAFGIRVHLSVDLSTGDAVTPAPEEYELPGLFDDTPAIRLLGYSRETILAEKIESVLTLSVYGTRPRDYYDLWLLSGDAIRGNILRDALRATCRHRGTEARLADARERLAAIETSAALRDHWERYRAAFPYAKDVSFDQTLAALRKFLDIVL